MSKDNFEPAETMKLMKSLMVLLPLTGGEDPGWEKALGLPENRNLTNAQFHTAEHGNAKPVGTRAPRHVNPKRLHTVGARRKTHPKTS